MKFGAFARLDCAKLNLNDYSDDQCLGRIYVGGLYLKQYPQEKTPQIAEKIKKIQECTKSIPLKSCLEQTLR